MEFLGDEHERRSQEAAAALVQEIINDCKASPLMDWDTADVHTRSVALTASYMAKVSTLRMELEKRARELRPEIMDSPIGALLIASELARINVEFSKVMNGLFDEKYAEGYEAGVNASLSGLN